MPHTTSSKQKTPKSKHQREASTMPVADDSTAHQDQPTQLLAAVQASSSGLGVLRGRSQSASHPLPQGVNAEVDQHVKCMLYPVHMLHVTWLYPAGLNQPKGNGVKVGTEHEAKQEREDSCNDNRGVCRWRIGYHSVPILVGPEG
jgi:hypothetical protein